MNTKKSKPVKKLKDFKSKIAPGTVLETAELATGVKSYFSNWEVRPAGNTKEIFSPEGYSKHAARWQAFREGKLKHPDQIYGLAQALAHIEELREEPKLKNASFEVVEVIIIKTAFKTTNF